MTATAEPNSTRLIALLHPRLQSPVASLRREANVLDCYCAVGGLSAARTRDLHKLAKNKTELVSLKY